MALRCVHRRAHLGRLSFSRPAVLVCVVSVRLSDECSVAQWMKKQEIQARRRALHDMAKSIWSANPREDWSRLTAERSEQLLTVALRQQHGVSPDAPPTAAVLPSEWEVSEFFHYTLQQQCPWRFAEVQRERRAYFERVLSELMRTLRRESETAQTTMQMTKNELTRRLTVAMGGKLPSADEVDAAWQDRHQLPAIDWMDDVV